MKDKLVYLHTPKTGGGSMEWFFWNQTKHLKTFFLSFNGIDYSYFNDNALSTRGPKGNKCVIETIHHDPRIVQTYNNSPHFETCRLLLGHTTSSFGELFPSYNFEYMTVIREPIERTISNMCQFSQVSRGGEFVKFGAYRTPHRKYSPEYWDFMYENITREFPIRGLMKHENSYMRNCMSKIICGDTYKHPDCPVTLDQVLEKAENIHISLYNDFNSGIQKHFDMFDIPIDMSQNHFAKSGKPDQNNNKKNTDKYYGAPQKVIEFVEEHNQIDIKFYNTFL